MLFAAHSPRGESRPSRLIAKTLFVMKWSIALLTVACLQVSARGVSQTINLHVREAPLKTVFSSIETQTSYIFFYKTALLREGHPVTLDEEGIPLKDVLDDCFRDQPFVYHIEGRVITIEPKPAAPPPGAEDLPTLPTPIHGKVTDSSGVPLPAVSIRVRGTRGGTVTETDGSFTINAKRGDVLLFSSTGYENTQVKVGESTTVAVVMSKSAQQLTAVVITALGIKREARSLGYSTAQVDNKDLNASQPVNFAAGITGKVSGMDIAQVNSGVDPDNIRITLRGNRSFLGNNEPLLVVDGIPRSEEHTSELQSPA